MRPLARDPAAKVTVERATVETPSRRAMESVVGVDRPGLVHEVSALLVALGMNVEELATDRSQPLLATACSTLTSA
jgi:glycine cleavage system regulatory protein